MFSTDAKNCLSKVQDHADIQSRIATTVYRCLRGMAPEYLSELFFPVKLRPSRYQLRSSQNNQLIVPPVKLSVPMDLVRLPCCWAYHLDINISVRTKMSTESKDVERHSLVNSFIEESHTRRNYVALYSVIHSFA